MSLLEPTYRMAISPAPAMEWIEYERLVTRDWLALLNRTPSPKECEIQAFLEQHPCLIPGAFNLSNMPSGHTPIYDAVIAQPPLPSYPFRKPDFMWLSRNSVFEEPVLLEIEAPNKKRFTKTGPPHADFTQAYHQITEWKSWFSDPVNQLSFKKFYRLEGRLFASRTFRPTFGLIYGRRAEMLNRQGSNLSRGQFSSSDVSEMTYDRLTPNPKAAQFISVRVDTHSNLTAIAVPPTLRFSPDFAQTLLDVTGIDAAIEINEHINSERKAFLIERIPYWIEYAMRSDKGIVNGGDSE